MAKLPDPSLTNRRSPTPGGPSGYLRGSHIGTPGAETSIGDALIGIGDEAYKFAMKEKARMDDVAVDDAKNQYLQQILDIEGEYNQIKGKAAVDQDIVTDYTTKIDGISEKLSSGFKNDSQRRAWDSYYKKSKVQFTAGVMKHKLNESDTYASETYKSTNITRIQNAHSNWADTGVVNNSASDIVKNIAKEKERVGWGDERTEVELKTALGPLWSGVAAQYINAKQYKMAKKILDQHQDVIGVDKYTSYHKSIEASETIDLSQEHAGRIFDEIEGEPAQLEYIRKTFSGDLETAIIKEIKIRHNERNTQTLSDKKELLEAQTKTKNDFAIDQINGTLNKTKIRNSNLEASDKIYFSNEYDKNAKKIQDISDKIKKAEREEATKGVNKLSEELRKAAEEKLKTDPYIEAELLHEINTNPTEETHQKISDHILNGISNDDGESLRIKLETALRGDDTKKSEDLKIAEFRLKSAETDILFDDDGGENAKQWSIKQQQLNKWIDQNPEGDPTEFVNLILEPVKDHLLDRIFKFTAGEELPSEIRQREIDIALGGKKKTVKKTVNKIETRKAKDIKKVKAKLMKRTDGTHYILFPNGTTKNATVDKEGKVSF